MVIKYKLRQKNGLVLRGTLPYDEVARDALAAWLEDYVEVTIEKMETIEEALEDVRK